MTENELSEIVIGACIDIHRSLGPGLLESAYQKFLAHELTLRGVPFEREVPVPVAYKGVTVDCGFRLDFWLERKVIPELKAVDRLLPIHTAQLLTYLKLTGSKLGLLINFNARLLKDGIVRVVNGL